MDSLFFIAAKLVGALLRVETWLLLVAVLTVWSAWRGRLGAAKRLSTFLVSMMLVVGLLPLGDLLLRPLEALYPRQPEGAPFDGIIVLGGGEDVGASRASGTPQLGEGADRYTTALALARRNQAARVLFSGGGARLRDIKGADISEAEIARQMFLSHGIAPERLTFEDRSRNTAENASRARDMLTPKAGTRWALVTSAFHMPRAMRSFEAVGWTGLVAYPTDYRTRLWSDGLGWEFARNLQMLNTALKEWVGNLAYTATGR